MKISRFYIYIERRGSRSRMAQRNTIQYACLVYNRNLIPEINNEMNQFTLSEQTFLYILLMEIRGKSISYSTFRKKKMLEKEKSLKQEIFHVRTGITRLGKEAKRTRKHKKTKIKRSMYQVKSLLDRGR